VLDVACGTGVVARTAAGITGPSVTGVDAELLPIADAMDAGTRSRIEADARTALTPFIGADGSIAAPIEVHLIAAG
jgi:2-polyprenyl-3-methyl-5-hydroxy-6-metoxy-1,4-benzoquinol methylase